MNHLTTIAALSLLGCVAPTGGSATDRLSAINDRHLYVYSGVSQSGTADNVSGAWIYTSSDSAPAGGYCPVLDDSFGGSYGGLAMTVVSYGGNRLGAGSDLCDLPKLELVGATGELASNVVEVHDASQSITATFESSVMLESRSAMARPSTGSTRHDGWSHPDDLVGTVPVVSWQPAREGPESWTVTGVAAGDDVAYEVPPDAPQVPGTTTINTHTVAGTLPSCAGAIGCKYSLDHSAAF